MQEARETWTRLAKRSANVFSTWDWAEIWLRHFGEGRRPAIAAVRHDTRIAAILPLYVQRLGGLEIARFVGHGVADQLGPVCHPTDSGTATKGLAAVLAGGVLLAERMPGDRDWPRELGGRMINQESSPVIEIVDEGDWDCYLRARSANFRQQVRRRARRLQRGLGLSFRLAQDADRLQADFNVLLALHAARWGTRSSAFKGPREAFHREFAARALERGWLRLWLAEDRGTAVAAWYGFRFAGVESYYQSGRDPRWDRFSLGAGILEHSIREAFADGMQEYRLLRGNEPYKDRYATRDLGLTTIAAGYGSAGRAVSAAVSLLMSSGTGRHVLKWLMRRGAPTG